MFIHFFLQQTKNSTKTKDTYTNKKFKKKATPIMRLYFK